MIKKVQEYMEKHHMIDRGDVVLVGVSGGADSVCLFRIFQKLMQTMDFSMKVLHVEHGIRGEDSVADAKFVDNLCQKYRIPYSLYSVDVPDYSAKHHLGDEEAARVLRYEAFHTAAQEELQAGKCVKIALAHHMDDNAETMLFQMIRGSGLAGMCGMKPVRKESDGMCYIRPLLGVTRTEIEAYLSACGQEYCTDATNFEIDYSRNRIRNCILPELKKVNEQAVLHMNQTAERLMDVKEYMDSELDAVADRVIQRVENQVTILLGELGTMPAAVSQEIVRRAIFLAAGKQKDITAVHVRDVLGLSELQSGRQIDLPYGIIARREYDCVILEKMEDVGCNWSIQISASQLEALWNDCKNSGQNRSRTETIQLGADRGNLTFRVRQFLGNQEEIPKKAYTKWLNYDMIKSGFLLRNRRPGDYFYTDSLGHRKKLKEYFINEKIPLKQREQILLLADGSQVYWIIGGRMSESCKISGETNYILEIDYNGGK